MSTVADEVPILRYTWKIPSLSASDRLVLCSGYFRQINLQKLITPHCIIELLNQYFKPNDADALYRIKTASKFQKFSSMVFEMYQFKWMICLYPNGKANGKNRQVYLQLRQLTALASGEHELIKVAFTLRILEARCVKPPRCIQYFTFDATKSDGGWHDENVKLKFHELKEFNTLTIRLELQLITVTDDCGNDITENILHESQRKYEKKVQKNLLQTKLNPIRDDKGIKEVKNWLTYEVKLPEYFGLFIENGVEDLFTMKLVTEKTLNKMGIKIIGHKLKILQYIQILLDEDNNKNNNNKKCCGNKRVLDDINDNIEDEQPRKKIKK